MIEVRPSVSVTVSPGTVVEDGFESLIYTFTRNSTVNEITTVNFSVGGSATYLDDYTQTLAGTFSGTSGTVTFGYGQSTALVYLDPVAEQIIEPDENVILKVLAGSNYAVSKVNTATGVIATDDFLPVVTVTTSPGSISEDGSASLNYVFTRTQMLDLALMVNFDVSGTATFGTDYKQFGAVSFSGTHGTVAFGFGQDTATVEIDSTPDTDFEPNETVILKVANSSTDDYGIGVNDTATGTINNDDAGPPEISVAVSPASVWENGAPNLLYTFTRTGSTTNALTVNFKIGGTATFVSDYTQSGAATFSGSTGSVSFGFGQSTATVIVNPKSDSVVESDETVCLTLTSSPNYTVGTVTPVKGTIKNDDTGISLVPRPRIDPP